MEYLLEVFKRSCFKRSIFSKEVFVIKDEGLQRFCDINLQLLNQYTRGNQVPFMAKQLSKEIMKRARLFKIFLRNGMEENKIFYNRQRNYSVSLAKI